MKYLPIELFDKLINFNLYNNTAHCSPSNLAWPLSEFSDGKAIAHHIRYQVSEAIWPHQGIKHISTSALLFSFCDSITTSLYYPNRAIHIIHGDTIAALNSDVQSGSITLRAHFQRVIKSNIAPIWSFSLTGANLIHHQCKIIWRTKNCIGG